MSVKALEKQHPIAPLGVGSVISTVIIGAGPAGLAMSQQLTQHDITHVVLERGEIANSWRHERWDSMKLLTPNEYTLLPGQSNAGKCAEGFMSASDFVSSMDCYAEQISAPIHCGVSVSEVSACHYGYRVVTNRGEWFCQSVVLATGAFASPSLPRWVEAIPEAIHSVHSKDYRNPDQLDAGDVLVVGASATGLQLAREIRKSGRNVTLAVGEHVRIPRSYRGKDIFWWMAESGLSGDDYQNQDDLSRVRRLPSPQLVGDHSLDILDLNTLVEEGVQLVGRLAGSTNSHFQFSGGLKNVCTLADLKLNRLLDRFDDWANKQQRNTELSRPKRFKNTVVDEQPLLALPHSGVRTVIWANGLKPDYSWLNVPVFDQKGRLQHDGGVIRYPGLYALGLPFLRHRHSSYIQGIGEDAKSLVIRVKKHLESCSEVEKKIC